MARRPYKTSVGRPGGHDKNMMKLAMWAKARITNNHKHRKEADRPCERCRRAGVRCIWGPYWSHCSYCLLRASGKCSGGRKPSGLISLPRMKPKKYTRLWHETLRDWRQALPRDMIGRIVMVSTPRKPSLTDFEAGAKRDAAERWCKEHGFPSYGDGEDEAGNEDNIDDEENDDHSGNQGGHQNEPGERSVADGLDDEVLLNEEPRSNQGISIPTGSVTILKDKQTSSSKIPQFDNLVAANAYIRRLTEMFQRLDESHEQWISVAREYHYENQMLRTALTSAAKALRDNSLEPQFILNETISGFDGYTTLRVKKTDGTEKEYSPLEWGDSTAITERKEIRCFLSEGVEETDTDKKYDELLLRKENKPYGNKKSSEEEGPSEGYGEGLGEGEGNRRLRTKKRGRETETLDQDEGNSGSAKKNFRTYL